LNRAEAVVDFLQSLTITSGALAGTKFRLRSWQRRVVERIYAEDDTGKRLVRTVVISMGRKSGKTVFAAALALCHMVGPEARPRGAVISAAADRPQAGLLFDEIQAFTTASTELHGSINFRSHNKTASCPALGTTFACLSSDATKAHGHGAAVAIVDELGQWKRRELLDAIQTGQGSHAEPLLIIISTRSPDPTSPLESLITYGRDVESGAIEDDGFMSVVYSADPKLDIFDPEAWIQANPDMTEARRSDIESQARQARHLPSAQPAFAAYVCNLPISTDDRWMSQTDWDACAAVGAATGPCVAGLDLSAGRWDLTALALFWPESKRLDARVVIPEGMLAEREAEDRAPYAAWHAAGLIHTCPGRAIDPAWLANWLGEQLEGLDVVTVAVDRWMMENLQQAMSREGVNLPLVGHGQGFRDMSPALGALEALVLDGRLKHGGNPLLRAGVACAAIEMDPAGGRKLTKLRSRGRIDAAIAAVMAVGAAERIPAAPSYAFTGMSI
jgi:phage terminase large subunit-like protein